VLAGWGTDLGPRVGGGAEQWIVTAILIHLTCVSTPRRRTSADVVGQLNRTDRVDRPAWRVRENLELTPSGVQDAVNRSFPGGGSSAGQTRLQARIHLPCGALLVLSHPTLSFDPALRFPGNVPSSSRSKRDDKNRHGRGKQNKRRKRRDRNSATARRQPTPPSPGRSVSLRELPRATDEATAHPGTNAPSTRTPLLEHAHASPRNRDRRRSSPRRRSDINPRFCRRFRGRRPS